MLIACRECNNQISNEAKTCPHCGIAIKKPFSFWRFFFGTILIALIAVAIFGKKSNQLEPIAITDQAAQAETTEAKEIVLEPSPTPMQEEPPIEIKAQTLSHNYNYNEARGDITYKDKSLLVSGVVSSIDKDMFGNTLVKMRGEKEYFDVIARMENDQLQKAAMLKKGQSINVACIGAGMIIKSPVLHACRFK